MVRSSEWKWMSTALGLEIRFECYDHPSLPHWVDG